MQFVPLRLSQAKCLRYGITNFLLFLLLSAAGLATATAAEPGLTEPATSLTLQDALRLALKANPGIAVAMREREAIEGVMTQAAARPNPSVSASIQDTRSDARETTLQLNQEFELGGKRDARIEAADSIYNKAAIEIESKRAEIHADVVAAFYEVLAAQERLNLARSSLEVAGLALDAAAKRVKAGKSSPVEETRSRVAESTTKIEFTQASSQLVTSRRRLAALWGNKLPVFERAEGQVELIPVTATLDELSAQLGNAPAIRLAKAEIQARDASTKIERSKSTPNITISAGVVNNQELGRNQALLGLSIPIPIFDRNQGNLQEAISRSYKAQDELAALENQLQADLAGQYERLNSGREAAELLRNSVLPGAQSAFDAANKGFAAGKFDFLDVLDAQRTLFQAKSQYINALLDAHQAIAEIERILGSVITGGGLSSAKPQHDRSKS